MGSLGGSPGVVAVGSAETIADLLEMGAGLGARDPSGDLPCLAGEVLMAAAGGKIPADEAVEAGE